MIYSKKGIMLANAMLRKGIESGSMTPIGVVYGHPSALEANTVYLDLGPDREDDGKSTIDPNVLEGLRGKWRDETAKDIKRLVRANRRREVEESVVMKASSSASGNGRVVIDRGPAKPLSRAATHA
mgnify:CR=1 FL=1